LVHLNKFAPKNNFVARHFSSKVLLKTCKKQKQTKLFRRAKQGKKEKLEKETKRAL
jgi:hypothetical protein